MIIQKWVEKYMVFYILISIVFIAELIITYAILSSLYKVNKSLVEYNSLISELKPKIGELFKIGTKISEQMIELAPIVVENIRSMVMNMIIGQLKSALAGLTFWLVKTEVEKHAK